MQEGLSPGGDRPSVGLDGRHGDALRAGGAASPSVLVFGWVNRPGLAGAWGRPAARCCGPSGGELERDELLVLVVAVQLSQTNGDRIDVFEVVE